jgi:hypothetical protein
VSQDIDIPLIDLRGQKLSPAQYKLVIPRAGLDVAHALLAIEPILERVKQGDAGTLRALGLEFDGVEPLHIRESLGRRLIVRCVRLTPKSELRWKFRSDEFE